ncbi:MAG: SIS domain-containing protein [Actinomycetota bacterium]
MSHIEQEIADQPNAWRLAVEAADREVEKLPTFGRRVAFVGCGTSLYMSQAIAALRESSGDGESDAFPASEFPSGRKYDLIVAISRSGTTTEVVRLLAGIEGTPTLAVTAVDRTPVVSEASRSIVIDFADEESVVQTRFATSALALFRSHLGESLDAAIGDAERMVTAELPVDPTAFEQFVSLGTAWRAAIASEAALKMREATGTWAEAYPAMEYRHGPISVATDRTCVWAFGEVEASLLDQVRATGASVVNQPEVDAMAHLILAQRSAVALAQARGLDPDKPRNLTRSVVLT